MNQVGQKILQLCCSYDMQIANDRFNGDIFGNFTHFNKNTGQSTVDLALISDNIFDKIDDFKVLPQNSLSDHCKIMLTIKNFKTCKVEEDKYQWQPLRRRYKWTEESPLVYAQALGSNEIDQMLNECNQRIDAGLIESSGVALKNVFLKSSRCNFRAKALQK